MAASTGFQTDIQLRIRWYVETVHARNGIYRRTGHTAQGDVIAAANTAGEIFVLDATGELLTRVKCLGEVFSSPVLVDSLLLVGCRDDSVYCFEFEG